MNCCPKCGGTEFEVQYRASGTPVIRERPDGSTEGMENTGMWDGIRLKRTKKKKRCFDCNAVIKEG